MAETSELENELLLKVSRDSKKNKEFSYRFVNNASLYLGDVLGDKLLNKRTLAEANYYIYPTNLFKDIENFQQSPCTEKVCKELIDKCKSILDNYLLSEEEQLNQVRNVINVSIDGVKNFNQFCQFCDSMMRILTSGYFDSSQKGGVTLLGNPNNIYINSNAVNRFELRYFYVIIHEYLHLITMKGNKSGISDLDSEDSVLLNILNEGITDIFAGLFTYYCCARMYRDNKESGRKFYLYENGVVLSLKEIEERVSPFLKDLKTVKNFKDISEVLIELQQGKLNLKYETNKLYEGPYYSNIIVIYFLMQKVGIDYFYKSYFANDFELLDSYLITKLSIYWREIKDNISTSINVNFMDSMLLIKVLKIIEKAGV